MVATHPADPAGQSRDVTGGRTEKRVDGSSRARSLAHPAPPRAPGLGSFCCVLSPNRERQTTKRTGTIGFCGRGRNPLVRHALTPRISRFSLSPAKHEPRRHSLAGLDPRTHFRGHRLRRFAALHAARVRILFEFAPPVLPPEGLFLARTGGPPGGASNAHPT